MDKNIFCVIMAGGVGSRFWPLSKTSKPKQFLDILGTGKTLLQQTFDRFKSLLPVENIFIVSNRDYKELILEQLPEINAEQVLLEPMRKNTAPCIEYANFKILKINPQAKIIVTPSDHLILKENIFLDVVKKGLTFVESQDALLTLGITPNRPETGYGYIQVNGNKNVSGIKNLHRVKTFTEKPDLSMAKVFLESGDFYWNAGIFIWSLASILKAFEIYLPDIHALFSEGVDLFNTPKEEEFIYKIYSECKNISVDYGIMEKASNVFVLCSDFGWSDLGTWGSLYNYLPKDTKGNSLSGDNVFAYDLKKCIVNVTNNKLAVLQGLEDFIIVETEDTLLVCKKQDEQKIKQFVTEVKLKKGDQYI